MIKRKSAKHNAPRFFVVTKLDGAPRKQPRAVFVHTKHCNGHHHCRTSAGQRDRHATVMESAGFPHTLCADQSAIRATPTWPTPHISTLSRLAVPIKYQKQRILHIDALGMVSQDQLHKKHTKKNKGITMPTDRGQQNVRHARRRSDDRGATRHSHKARRFHQAIYPSTARFSSLKRSAHLMSV